MSDVPVVNVEDDEPAAPPAVAPAVPAAPVAAAPPPAPADEDEAEPDQAEGLLAALRAARAKNKELKGQAAKAAELERTVNEMRPYAEFVRANPGLTQRPAPVEPQKPTDDPDAEEAARLMEFWTTDSKPDVERGRRWLALQERRSARVAEQQIKPLAQSMATSASQQNYNALVNTPAANGVKPNPAMLAQIWRSVDPSLTADPNLAVAIHAMAAGMTQAPPAGVTPPAGPPVVTEAAGSPPRNKASVSSIERSVAANKGWTDEKMAELSKGYVKGRTTQLED